MDDAATASAYNGGFEFKDAVKQANEYAYDPNGNLSKDLNKNISSIQYNCLNLPSKVTFGDGSAITYTYSADGTKLRAVYVINGSTTTTDYCGNVVYENGMQKWLLTDEGYVSLSDGQYHYYLKDHQGNNRVVINSAGTVEETNHYYPFGGTFASTNAIQPYKYNGKEYDAKKGLNWYDYGARWYDAGTGRFTAVDPMASCDYPTSVYAYCANNPVIRIDQDGKIWDIIWDIGNMVYDAGAAIVNHIKGDHEAAQSHWVDFGADAVAAAVPFVPAGATKALKVADKGVDAVKAAKQVDKVADVAKGWARFIGDTDGKLIDIQATPKGTYVHPNGAETDVLGREHFNKIGGGKVESVGTSHTHNKGRNIDKKGLIHEFREDKAHAPTYEEIQNIRDRIARKKER